MEFDFYLDAWKYCKENRIDQSKIKKLSFRKWIISYA